MSTSFHDENDPLAARLRDALTSEAAMVTPSDDGLQQIRSGIDQHTKRPWWKHPATPALAAALVLGVMAGGVAVFAGGDNKDDNVVATQPSTSTLRVGVGAAGAVRPAGHRHADSRLGRGRHLRLLRDGRRQEPAALPRSSDPTRAPTRSRRR
jgi:hypothetical protein